MKIAGAIWVIGCAACIAASTPWHPQSMSRRCQLEWHAQNADRDHLCKLPVDLPEINAITLKLNAIRKAKNCFTTEFTEGFFLVVDQ